MAFLPQFLDDIRAHLALNEIAARHVRLTRQGNEFKGLCPFHNEKTPSFTINEDKGFFHCFGCGAHGDIFGFVMRTEGLNFIEAVERLATECGLAIPARSQEEHAKAELVRTLYELNEVASSWFERCLNNQVGKSARTYLAERGLDNETSRHFRLGFAPDRGNPLLEFLRNKRVEDKLSLASGLIRQSDDGRSAYDFFRGRIMFPITDARGRVIAFGGRSIGESKAKYINSPETELFRKGHALYNVADARGPALQQNSLIVAEGYMDVIALHRAGFHNSVAPLGTALTEHQIKQLWRLAPEPLLCFDGDEAGQHAARRAAERALPQLGAGLSLRFAFLPVGQDPDSLLANGSSKDLARALGSPVSLIDFLWSWEIEVHPLDTPERRAALRQRLNQLTTQITDRTIREGYFADFKKKFGDRFALSQRSTSSGARNKRKTFQAIGLRAHARGHDRSGDPNHRERVLVAILLGHPELLAEVREDFSRIEIRNVQLEQLRTALLEISTSESQIDYQAARTHLAERGHGEVIAKLFDRTEWNQTMIEPSVRPETDRNEALFAWRETLAIHCNQSETPDPC